MKSLRVIPSKIPMTRGGGDGNRTFLNERLDKERLEIRSFQLAQTETRGWGKCEKVTEIV